MAERLYEYRCSDCRRWWVGLDMYDNDVRCPECGKSNAKRLWRSISAVGNTDGWERTDAGWVQKEMVKGGG